MTCRRQTRLVLKAQGSFFAGGDKVEQSQGELGDLGTSRRRGSAS